MSEVVMGPMVSEREIARAVRRAEQAKSLDLAETTALLAARGDMLERLTVVAARVRDALARTAVTQGAEVREGVPVGALAAIGDRVRGVQRAEGQIEARAAIRAA